ncbi:hypothetical protein NEIPOLOT_02230 [Neisseria polysaccharea ATCC 43768]|nr:hypothetical protein NEIPOLOT_02230 [Neisseria polysaccharea ATCC 43768]
MPTTSAKSSRQAPASCANRRKCRLKAEYRFRRHLPDLTLPVLTDAF